MVKYLFPFLFLMSLSILADDSPRRVLVIYKENDLDRDSNGVPDSKDVALYYQQKRSVPAQNLLGLTTTVPSYEGSQANLHLFYTEMVRPIRQKLDSIGKDSIYYMVLCKGIPYSITKKNWTYSGLKDFPVGENLALIYSIGDDTTNSNIYPGNSTSSPNDTCNNPFWEPSPGVGTDLGHFDHSFTFKGASMYLVTELDGISYQAAKELVDRALYGERYIYNESGYYRGMGYVDYQCSDTAHPSPYTETELRASYSKGYHNAKNGDFNMAMGQVFLHDLGWPYEVESSFREIGDTIGGYPYYQLSGEPALTAPNALWYEGWYNFGKYPRDCWTWLPGAVACDLNSNSLASVSLSCWAGGALCQGVTATCGPLSEPARWICFIEPENLLYSMLHGFNYAEAVYHAEPTLGWKNRIVGDPLYNPLRPKTPVKDTVAPPAPLVQTWAPGGDLRKRTVTISINTDGREPDLALCRFRYGKNQATDSIKTWERLNSRIYSMYFKYDLTALDSHSIYHFTVTLADPVGNVTQTGDLSFSTDSLQGVVGIAEPKGAIVVCPPALFAPSPNPFNPSTLIRYQVPGPSQRPVMLSIFNLDGKIVASLVNQKMAPGQHQVVWNGGKYSAGVYLVRLRSGGFTATRKILLVK